MEEVENVDTFPYGVFLPRQGISTVLVSHLYTRRKREEESGRGEDDGFTRTVLFGKEFNGERRWGRLTRLTERKGTSTMLVDTP